MKKAVASVTVMAWDISNVMNASGENQRIEDSMKKKIYISGKIGEEVLSDETREKFAKAEKMLRSKGYDVFNPTTSGLGRCAEEAAKKYKSSFYKEILIYDLMALKQCDAIYMLDDWKKSPGAGRERSYAMATGIRLFHQDRFDACEECIRQMYIRVKYGTPVPYYRSSDRTGSELECIKRHLESVWLPI